MNTSEAGALLGKTAWFVRRQCANGELRASYFGGSWFIEPEAITAYKDARSNATEGETSRRRRRRSA